MFIFAACLAIDQDYVVSVLSLAVEVVLYLGKGQSLCGCHVEHGRVQAKLVVQGHLDRVDHPTIVRYEADLGPSLSLNLGAHFDIIYLALDNCRRLRCRLNLVQRLMRAN